MEPNTNDSNNTPRKKSVRRDFIKKSLLGTAAASAGLVACTDDKKSQSPSVPYINFNNTYLWKLVTTWPPNFPIVGGGCNMMAQWIEEMSGGRMKIQVFGGGELIPSLECFDAVRNGAVEMGHGASYYWAGKVPAGQFFSSVPFGMNSQQMFAWVMSGGGLKLWEELYEPFGLLPIPSGNTGIQMGGWFNKEINAIEDIQGLKMRIPGFGGKVFAKAGGTAVTVPGGELYTNLERGVIDATEWIGPYHDYLMGFHQVAKYYYYPGWHEPGTILELIVNKEKFEALPTDLQQIVRTACYRVNHWMWTEFDAQNGYYLSKLRDEENVDFRAFPTPVLDELRVKTAEVIEEIKAQDPRAVKIADAYSNFKDRIQGWSAVSDQYYYGTMR